MEIFLIILGILALIVVGILMTSIRVSVSIKLGKENKIIIAVFGKALPQKSKTNKRFKFANLKKTVEFLFSSEVGLWGRLGNILKKAVIQKFRLNITVASEDAAATALLYGGICSVLYPVVGFLETVMNFKEDNMKIVCNYETNEPDLDFFTEIKIRGVHLFTAVFKIIPEIKKFLKEVTKNEQ